jgi:hypothetical protein
VRGEKSLCVQQAFLCGWADASTLNHMSPGKSFMAAGYIMEVIGNENSNGDPL